jgi:hypothetical protein
VTSILIDRNKNVTRVAKVSPLGKNCPKHINTNISKILVHIKKYYKYVKYLLKYYSNWGDFWTISNKTCHAALENDENVEN